MLLGLNELILFIFLHRNIPLGTDQSIFRVRCRFWYLWNRSGSNMAHGEIHSHLTDVAVNQRASASVKHRRDVKNFNLWTKGIHESHCCPGCLQESHWKSDVHVYCSWSLMKQTRFKYGTLWKLFIFDRHRHPRIGILPRTRVIWII